MNVLDILLSTLVSMADPIRLVIVLFVALWVRSMRGAIVATFAVTVGWFVLTLVLATVAERDLPGLIVVSSILSSVLLCALAFGAGLFLRSRRRAEEDRA